jgi:halocyanin-like protein
MSRSNSELDRRTVLRSTGAAVIGMTALAGCADDPEEEVDDAADDVGEDDEPEDDDTDDVGEDDEPEDDDTDDVDEDEEDAEFVDDDEEPDYGEFMDDVPNYEGTYDFRGEETVEVAVGAGDDGLLFEPAAIMVDPGTEVVWEWTGEGGEHNVETEEGEELESELTDEEGFTYEHTFEEEGEVTLYVCTPHEAQGKKGAVAVDGEAEEEDDAEVDDDADVDDDEAEVEDDEENGVDDEADDETED